MKCPIDNEDLVMTERSGVEIDYCPKCRGVWLDRGELDKIIDRSAPDAGPANDDFRPQRRRDEGHGSRPHGKKKKKESFLSELFDF